jgi:hypothetical protein
MANATAGIIGHFGHRPAPFFPRRPLAVGLAIGCREKLQVLETKAVAASNSWQCIIPEK